MADIPTFTLNDGTTQPAIGFGTYPMTGDDAVAAVGSALAAGYRLIDTAQLYGNELEVGEALHRSGLARSEVQIQTKLNGGTFGFDHFYGEVSATLGRLKLDRIDMMLIHWPGKTGTDFVDQWRALIACQAEGTATSIGVSNFSEAQLQLLIDETGVTPAVNQIELHPLKPQEHMREVHARLGIVTQAWSPLGNQNPPFDAPPIVRAAREHAATAAQVVLCWHHMIGTLPLPKSADAARMAENLDTFGWSLTADEVREISALGA